MGNGEGVEGEADAAVHGEYLHGVATIEGDALAAAVQRQVFADRECAADGDGPTTTECDRVPSGGAAQDGADPPRTRLPTTVGDGQGGGWLGVGRARDKQAACQHADPEQQGDCDQARPGRETKSV